MEYLDLQLFAGADDDVDDFDLDDFDLDLDDDDEGSSETFDRQEQMISKERASKLVQKRLAKERAKYDAELASKNQVVDKFQKLYGVSLEEALAWGGQQIAQPVAAPAPQPVTQQPPDPYTAKLMEIDNWRKEEDSRRQREQEALEFVRQFPGMADKDIPSEVIARRARGGISLVEAYKAHMFDTNAQNAAQNATVATARNINARKVMRTEGADYTGINGSKTTVDMLDPEDRKLAAQFDMTPKELIAYRRKMEKYKNQE